MILHLRIKPILKFFVVVFSMMTALLSESVWGQGTTCANATAAPTNCTTGYNVSNTAGISASPQCVGNVDPPIDGWYTWTPTAGVYDIDIGGGGGGKDIGVAVYSGTCGDLTTQACSNMNDAGNSSETINPFLADGSTTYYIQIFKVSGSNNITGTFCITKIPETTINSCSTTSYDPGGAGGSTTTSGIAGNYADNAQNIYTFCSNDPLNPYVTLNFSAFQLESGLYDFITIYDGAGMENLILGNYTGSENPGTITSSTGCLTIYFTSDFSVNRLGWEAAVSCTNIPGVLPTPTIADCLGAIGLCGTSTTNVSGFGSGTYDDLSSANDGCLVGEHNTIWYFLKIDDADGDGDPNTSGSGTLGFTLTMPNQVDYDYAMWGPLEGDDPSDFCSPKDMPSRCSYSTASGNSNTTMGLDATSDPDQISEGGGTSEDAWLYYYDNVQDGEVYLLMIDRWGSDVHDYTLTFNGTASNTGGLDCAITPLPIDLYYFEAYHVSNRYNVLNWTTSSEHNSDHFQIERSVDGTVWDIIATKKAAGNSTQLLSYSFIDEGYHSPISYYRIKMFDIDGTFKITPIRSVACNLNIEGSFSAVFPNPSNESFYFLYGGKDFSTPIEVEIISSNGSVINNETFETFSKSQGLSMNTSALANGIYQVIIRQGEYREVKKLSVMH